MSNDMEKSANRRGWGGFVGLMLLGALCIAIAWVLDEPMGWGAVPAWMVGGGLFVMLSKPIVAAS